MGKIEQNKAQKRTAILRAAEEVLVSEGYIHASMDKIADRAQVTKQTVYRYFPSKDKLFKATLVHIGESVDEEFLTHLQLKNTKKALVKFATSFIQFHLSEKHLAVFRLLVSEARSAPEITASFFEVGPSHTDEVLSEFFSERLAIKNSESTVRLWTSMLLNYRSSVLVGMPMPNDQQIEKYAKEATDFLLASIS